MNENPTSDFIATTERFSLRKFNLGDVDDYFRLGSNPEVVKFTGAPKLECREQAAQVLQDRPMKDYQLYGYGRWAIVWSGTNEVIGFAGPKFLPELNIVDLGIWLLPEYWGRGIGTEATQVVIKYSFSTLNLPTLVGLVDPENFASQRMLLKAGLRFLKQFNYDSNPVLWYQISHHEWASHER